MYRQSNTCRSELWRNDYLVLRMSCTDIRALVFMFNKGSSCRLTISPIKVICSYLTFDLNFDPIPMDKRGIFCTNFVLEY